MKESLIPWLGQFLVLALFQLPQVLVAVQDVAPAFEVEHVQMAYLLADQVLQVEVHRRVVQVFLEAERIPVVQVFLEAEQIPVVQVFVEVHWSQVAQVFAEVHWEAFHGLEVEVLVPVLTVVREAFRGLEEVHQVLGVRVSVEVVAVWFLVEHVRGNDLKKLRKKISKIEKKLTKSKKKLVKSKKDSKRRKKLSN